MDGEIVVRGIESAGDLLYNAIVTDKRDIDWFAGETGLTVLYLKALIFNEAPFTDGVVRRLAKVIDLPEGMWEYWTGYDPSEQETLLENCERQISELRGIDPEVRAAAIRLAASLADDMVVPEITLLIPGEIRFTWRTDNAILLLDYLLQCDAIEYIMTHVDEHVLTGRFPPTCHTLANALVRWFEDVSGTGEEHEEELSGERSPEA